ncbi:thiopurine S-methyltransferase [Vibrio metschnikovii]|uniref:thiopurine S-methyltransferase n=1 Tax=Vibrio metschnikovii TaxID=28172 RepID=UPI001647F36A|nr:thiopurine S-methyltransferase [Vibrio metschnikovii]MBC3615806.1 thiopurine S-methyltransferase [Vibrio metschnikovii]MBC5811988.1 thiopurine S-methyltransferase [Vibrio metschnikovii]
MRDPEFWHNKWAANQLGFHLDDVNPLLMEYWSATLPQRSDNVFVPLCGKSEDLVWLAARHDEVQGVELSPIAVRAFFAEHFYTPLVTQLSAQHESYQFDELTLYTGDIFTAPLIPVDIIYDRAALIALPEEMRVHYAERLKSLLKPGGRILLISLDYPQEERSGPPFSVNELEIRQLFNGFDIQRLARDEVDAQHPESVKKGVSYFAEEVWLIKT